MAQGRTRHYLGLGPEKSLRPICVRSRGSREGVRDPLVIMRGSLGEPEASTRR